MCTVYRRQVGTNNKKPAYLAGFVGFFLAAVFGAGGVASMRRSTSSGLGGGAVVGWRFMDRV